MAVSRTGKLNKRLKFYFKDGTIKGPNGNSIPNWKEKYKCWFCYKQKYLDQITNEVGGALEDTTTIVIRQQQKEFPKMDWEIEIKQERYTVEKINPDVENENFLVIICKKVI